MTDPARTAALETLAAVRERGAYANLVLPGLLRDKRLKGRDAAFATELTYGTCRAQGLLDAVIESAAGRPTDRIDAVLLDLLRLGKKVGTLKEKNDYIFYVEAADPRRLPSEVTSVIDQAYSSGVIPKGSDSWIEEQYKAASGLVASDKAALPALERDANAPAAKLRTVMAAGDTFLSYGEYAKAAGFYEKSLTLADADRDASLTRLGIAQLGAGNTAAAIDTFGKVSGPRAPIAKLWMAYAQQQAKAATGGATAS